MCNVTREYSQVTMKSVRKCGIHFDIWNHVNTGSVSFDRKTSKGTGMTLHSIPCFTSVCLVSKTFVFQEIWHVRMLHVHVIFVYTSLSYDIAVFLFGRPL